LVFHGTPEALIAGARGRCWDWTIAPAQLPAVRQAFVVSQSIHRGASVQVRVLGARSPGAGALAVDPSLEDAYTDLLARDTTAADRAAPVLAQA
jgi:ABC-2 type transport system ATP-binding protein